jgi:signal transduction histidine kinase
VAVLDAAEPALPLFKPAGRMQVAWFTLGLWLGAYLLFLAPSFAANGRMAWQGYPIIAAAVAIGPVLSAPLYLLTRRIGGWPLLSRLLLVALAAAAVAFLHSFLDTLIVGAMRKLLGASAARPLTLEVIVDKFLSYVWLYELYVTGVGLILSSALAQERERQLAEARAAANQAQLAALRFQLNPHFLFNTLNALSTLVMVRRNADAEAMIDKLSEFLRASLSADPNSFIPLEEELATLQAYLDIEGVRFGDRLVVDFECPPELGGAKVPSLLLQPLVENAIKYGVAPTPRRPVTIIVGAAEAEGDLLLTVTDDGDGPAAMEPRPVSTGVGLENVRRRLSVLYGGRGSLEAASRTDGPGFKAVVRLPLELAGRRAPGPVRVRAEAA